MRELCIVVAMDDNRGIGKDNSIPWGLIPPDMKRFRDLTSGHCVIMGRRTFDSIVHTSGHPLKGRHNLVISRDPNFDPHYNGYSVSIFRSPEDAFSTAHQFEDNGRIPIIGGGQLYKIFLPFVDKLYITKISGDFGCDTFFPEYEDKFENVVAHSEGQAKGYSYQFVDLTK